MEHDGAADRPDLVVFLLPVDRTMEQTVIEGHTVACRGLEMFSDLDCADNVALAMKLNFQLSFCVSVTVFCIVELCRTLEWVHAGVQYNYVKLRA